MKTLFTTRPAKFLLFFLALCVAFRIALPFGLKWYINKTLNQIPGYYGYVENVHVALWRGAYRIDGGKLLKTNASRREPFFASDQIDIAVDWRALFHRRLLAKIELLRPELQFIERASKAASQTNIDESWQDKVRNLVPLDINRLSATDGVLRYKKETSHPVVDLYFQNVEFEAENLSNATGEGERLPSRLKLTALLLKSGETFLAAKLNPLTEPMEADIKTSIKNLNLTELNDFSDAYGHFTFSGGKFDATLELAASKSRYEGYVKTLLKKVEILGKKSDNSSAKKDADLGHLVWEGIVAAVVDIFKNGSKDQFAARIPLTGSRDQMKIKTWEALFSILQNGFVKAFDAKFEDSVHFSKVEGSQASISKAPTKSNTAEEKTSTTSDAKKAIDQKAAGPEPATSPSGH